MTKWEYTVVAIVIETKGVLKGRIEFSDDSLEQLNRLGDRGWELVSCIPIVAGSSGLGYGSIATGPAFGILKRPREG